jgi:pimeloyl-ACP methyl ester carboxylesterase
MRSIAALFIGGLTVVLVGCTPAFGPKAEHGITFYCPGAGNIDFGDAGIRDGLERAGYRGQVATVMWTVLFNPAIDQTLRINARAGSSALARRIEEYSEKYPGREVSVIGLSAGTGVAIWALEDLKGGCQVNNVVLLGSSLWHRYDVSKALPHVKGKIYNYYSPNDAVLAGPMKIFGTIDGVFAEDGAGAVGLHSPRGQDRIVNIRWRPEYRRYGYYGGHMDSTSPGFVQAYLSKHIMEGPTAALPGRTPAIARQTAPPVALRD